MFRLANLAPLLILLAILASNAMPAPAATNAQRWEVVELPFAADLPAAHANDPFAIEFGATFILPDHSSIRVPGFYNADGQWLIRFCPPATGLWTYKTHASLPELAGQSGRIAVAPNAQAWQRGPIQIDPTNPQRFAYADGSPYFLLAFELDWLFALDAENANDIPKTRQIVDAVAAHGFNQIVMNVYAYNAGWGERDRIAPHHNYAQPAVFPFGGTNENPDFSTLDITFFQRLDRVIAHLNEKQIAAHLMIYVWNKQVSWPEPESEADNRYFDYVVKRYQAYPNLIWDISKEALAYGRDDMGYITRRIHRLRRLDGHRRLLSVHDYNYCSAFPGEVDFISIQEWQPYLYHRMDAVRQRHARQPIFNIEHGGYEKSMPYSIFDGAYTDPIVCLDRNYQCIFAGTYSTYYWQHSSWYNVIADPFSLPAEQQPHFDYYQNIIKLFSEFNYNELRPVQDAFSAPMLTAGEDVHLFYLPEGRAGIFGSSSVIKDAVYTIRWLDPLSGEFHDGGQRDLSGGAWLGIHRPDEISGPLAIAILEATD